MSGKPYNIQEFKIIVDYLVQNKLYGEIKARKMWVDFANTKLTSRTWQSLKETFLKRILPDIHNPYFELTNEQISSFRARCDLANKNSNKLEIQTISDDSNSNGHNVKDNEPNNEGETSTGENIKCSKIPVRSRSSADTVILDNCYETAEEIQNELESNESDEKPVAAKKSFRDCITYSEPLTPMLQEVLNDFASEPEDSDREGQMEIVENLPEENLEDMQEIPEPSNEIPNNKSIATDIAKNAKGLSAELVEEVLAHELDSSSKPENKLSKKKTQNVMDEIEELPVLNLDDEISSMQAENGTERVDNTDGETPGATELVTAEVAEKLVVQNSETHDVIVVTDSHSEPQEQSGGLNNSNSTVDASLPNNPEALKNRKSKDVEAKADNKKAPESAVEVSNKSDKNPSSIKATRKRSCSDDNSKSIDNKKKKLDIKLKSPTKADKKASDCQLDADDKPKANEESIKPDVIKKPWLEENPIDINKPSTSFETRVVDLIETEKRSNAKESPVIENPCLQNISLFDEQFNKTKYNMSESSDTEQNKKETLMDKQEASGSKPDEIVELRSNSSDIGEVHVSPKKRQRAGVLISKSERDKAVSSMFGFTSGGGVGAKRKRQLSRRRRTVSHNNNTSHHTAVAPSHSSEWSSESASDEFVSPPRSRKNRPTKKYLKPQAAKISSLAEEGGLFVMYGKKIYPVVKDGKIVKNYITYLPESDSEEEGETFWKSKYVEEKKKAAELKKLLEAKEPLQIRDAYSPVPQVNPRNSRSETLAAEPANSVGKQISVPVPEEKKEEPKANPPEKIKIKFTRNNEEVHLEGHWPQIHPVLEQVVHIFHKEAEPSVNENRSKTMVTHPEPKESSSGVSTPIIITPVDPEVHEKVNKIEKEIFKEIEERDKEEENEPNEKQASNVTNRNKGRPRKSSSSVHSPEQQPKPSNIPEIKKPEENGRTRRQKAKEIENNNNNNTEEKMPKRQTRTPRKVLNETVNINESKTIQTRRSAQKSNSINEITNEDEEVRYMLPPKNNRRSYKSPANKNTSQKKRSLPTKTYQTMTVLGTYKEQKEPRHSLERSITDQHCRLPCTERIGNLEQAPKVVSSPDTVSLNSIDSTQGYQDSDVSPVNKETRKKKKIDMSSFMIRTRNSLRRSTNRRTHPYVYHDAYNDSSNSSADASAKVVTRENSSLNTEAYRSESYQLLNAQAKASSTQLERIDETTPIDNETYFVRHLESICRDEISAQINNNLTSPSCQITSDIGSSSNVSLPMSPELSLVENLSVSKEMLKTADFPTLNEMQSNEIKEATMCSKYMISYVDVSVPLMNQDLEFGSCNTITEMSTQPKSLVTESLVKKIGIFNINEQVSATETLNEKLQELLLESAKKTSESQKQASMMDVDVSNVAVQKKPKVNKKRCSTPQKRKGSKKSVAPTVDPVVEEEHVESCSHSGRKSCPPLFQTNLCNDNVVTEEINIANLSITNEIPKGRKKKDIIRVKILRPKKKRETEKIRAKSAKDASSISVFTDSGINDSESELFIANNSVDLIHNHSETCLNANECVGDSIEFVENSKSVITLGDSMQSGDNAWSTRCESNGEHSTSPDLFCNNAQDVSAYNKAYSDNIANTSDTVYYSPLGTEASPSSLITEDLSNDALPPARPSKWYLLSEDETNTNLVGAGSNVLSGGNFVGSNLRQIFPIACAIPDLSTITEMSRENDSSRKPTLEDLNGLTGDDFNSLSIFDSNFNL